MLSLAEDHSGRPSGSELQHLQEIPLRIEKEEGPDTAQWVVMGCAEDIDPGGHKPGMFFFDVGHYEADPCDAEVSGTSHPVFARGLPLNEFEIGTAGVIADAEDLRPCSGFARIAHLGEDGSGLSRTATRHHSASEHLSVEEQLPIEIAAVHVDVVEALNHWSPVSSLGRWFVAALCIVNEEVGRYRRGRAIRT